MGSLSAKNTGEKFSRLGTFKNALHIFIEILVLQSGTQDGFEANVSKTNRREQALFSSMLLSLISQNQTDFAKHRFAKMTFQGSWRESLGKGRGGCLMYLVVIVRAGAEV
jgi:hypothetical protein